MNRYRKYLKTGKLGSTAETKKKLKLSNGCLDHNWLESWGCCHLCDADYLSDLHDKARLRQQDAYVEQLCERIEPSGPRITIANATREQVIDAMHRIGRRSKRKKP